MFSEQNFYNILTMTTFNIQEFDNSCHKDYSLSTYNCRGYFKMVYRYINENMLKPDSRKNIKRICKEALNVMKTINTYIKNISFGNNQSKYTDIDYNILSMLHNYDEHDLTDDRWHYKFDTCYNVEHTSEIAIKQVLLTRMVLPFFGELEIENMCVCLENYHAYLEDNFNCDFMFNVLELLMEGREMLIKNYYFMSKPDMEKDENLKEKAIALIDTEISTNVFFTNEPNKRYYSKFSYCKNHKELFAHLNENTIRKLIGAYRRKVFRNYTDEINDKVYKILDAYRYRLFYSSDNKYNHPISEGYYEIKGSGYRFDNIDHEYYFAQILAMILSDPMATINHYGYSDGYIVKCYDANLASPNFEKYDMNTRIDFIKNCHKEDYEMIYKNMEIYQYYYLFDNIDPMAYIANFINTINLDVKNNEFNSVQHHSHILCMNKITVGIEETKNIIHCTLLTVYNPTIIAQEFVGNLKNNNEATIKRMICIAILLRKQNIKWYMKFIEKSKGALQEIKKWEVSYFIGLLQLFDCNINIDEKCLSIAILKSDATEDEKECISVENTKFIKAIIAILNLYGIHKLMNTLNYLNDNVKTFIENNDNKQIIIKILEEFENKLRDSILKFNAIDAKLILEGKRSETLFIRFEN